jgi:hypothetical protein
MILRRNSGVLWAEAILRSHAMENWAKASLIFWEKARSLFEPIITTAFCTKVTFA